VKKKIFQSFKAAMIFSFVVITALSFVATASATNGYFSHGYSTKNKALGGAGTALPLDSLAASTNPAGMVFMGDRIDLGVSFFNPNREYTAKGGTPPPPGCPGGPGCPFTLKEGTVESDSNWFIVPSLGANWKINNDSSFGISIFGNGGMNTDYDEATFNFLNPTLPSETGVDLMQLFIVPTYARKITPKHAFGISPVFAYQAFEAKGLEIFGAMGISNNADKLTGNGHDNSYGYGARIGYLGEVLPNLYLGASYQTEIYMSRLKKYEGLFAEDGDFDIPQNWSVGLAYNATPALTFALDMQKIYYSDIASVGNTFNPAFTNCVTGNSSYCLGGSKGMGFGWDDMTIYKFGVQWQSSPDWTWRAGYSYGKQPIPDDEVLFNILAPGVIEQHVTAGVTKKTGDKQELDFTVTRALSNSVKGKNPLDPAQKIELTMDQWEISLGYAWKF
jgi:long-chain fatty acid transport protein